MAKACVFTALIGSYEALNEQPVALKSDLDFICFTDDAGLTSDTWKVVHVTPTWPTDLIRSSRALKILGHPALAEYERTVWMDNSTILLRDPGFLTAHVDRLPIAMLNHWDHADIFEEFQAALYLGLEDPHRLYEQINAYAMAAPDVLQQKPYATTIMVRQRWEPLDPLDRTMRLWMDHVLRYSRRDQLSINYVLAETGLQSERIHGDLRSSNWASWPHTINRNRAHGLRQPSFLSKPPLALAHEIRQRELAFEDELRRVSHERDVLRSEMEVMSELHCREVAGALEEAHRQGKVISAQAHEIASLRASTSWRVTHPFRALANRARALRTPRAKV